ncbi:hypothetical protein ACWKSP_04025 [Micromonosporaceae bacterium Da 78-11]
MTHLPAGADGVAAWAVAGATRAAVIPASMAVSDSTEFRNVERRKI